MRTIRSPSLHKWKIVAIVIVAIARRRRHLREA